MLINKQNRFESAKNLLRGFCGRYSNLNFHLNLSLSGWVPMILSFYLKVIFTFLWMIKKLFKLIRMENLKSDIYSKGC